MSRPEGSLSKMQSGVTYYLTTPSQKRQKRKGIGVARAPSLIRALPLPKVVVFRFVLYSRYFSFTHPLTFTKW